MATTYTKAVQPIGLAHASSVADHIDENTKVVITDLFIRAFLTLSRNDWYTSTAELTKKSLKAAQSDSPLVLKTLITSMTRELTPLSKCQMLNHSDITPLFREKYEFSSILF